MATPYVVPKIPLAKTSNDFDRCNGESGAISGCTADVPNVGTNSCRFSCSSWCPMCERNSTSGQHDSLTKSLVDGLRKVDSGIHDSLKTLQPVMNKLNTHTIAENLSHKLSNLTQKANIFVSPSKDVKNDTGSPQNGVHEKYVKEVEALKGKIQELRENLSRQFSESDNIMTSLPKLLWKESYVEPKTTGRVPHDEENSAPPLPPDSRRSKRLSESETCTSPAIIVGQKRPRDFSPDLNGIFCDKPVPNIPDNSAVNNTRQPNKPSGPSPVKLKEQNVPKGLPSPVKAASTPPSLPVVPVSSPPPMPVPVLIVEHCVESDVSKSTKKVEVRKSLHPALRPSLFPNVPPYIKFVYHDSQVDDQLPPAVSKVLRWKITTITPLVVRKTVLNSGFKLIKQSPEWTGTWGKHMKSVMFRTIRENQKINHFPGTFQIGRKDKLWKNLHHLMISFSKREFGFIPRTYILPQDIKLLRIAWERDGGNDSTWIVKPPASARGTGIKVVNKWNQIPKKAPIIVQKYISNPYLINGNKFDLRLYALVTSFNPLRIYLYDNGLVRFASVKYSEDLSSLSDRYMHLTNYSINKLSNNYHHNEDADACQGHKWTIKTLFTYLQEKIDVKALWERLVDLVIKTMMCGEMSICNLSRFNLTSHYCSYELFGVDVLLDEYLTPWLLEVNISPSLHSASPLDLAVKGPLIRDILNIAGYQIPDKLSDSLKNELKPKLGLQEHDSLCFNKDLYIAGLSSVEKLKHKDFVEVERSEYLDGILEKLTPDDVRNLIRYEDELTQIGSFEKVFPTAESHEYLKYFESPQYYNKLFDAWETKYGTNREEGIKHLRELCNKGVHLDIEDVSLHVSPSASELVEAASESTIASDVSESTQQRNNEKASNALKVLRKRRKVNFSGRPYSRFNHPRLRSRARTT